MCMKRDPPTRDENLIIPFVEIFEGFVAFNTFFLRHARMNADGGEVAFSQQFVQGCCTGNGFHKNTDLIELQRIQ